MLLQAGNGARPRATSLGVSAVLEILNRVHRFPKTRFLNERELLQPSPFDLTLSKKEENKAEGKEGGGGNGRLREIQTLRHFFSSFRFFLPDKERGPGFTEIFREGAADLRRRFSDRLARLSL